jgi:hypothetical protein
MKSSAGLILIHAASLSIPSITMGWVNFIAGSFFTCEQVTDS